jgi:hypothetical protein
MKMNAVVTLVIDQKPIRTVTDSLLHIDNKTYCYVPSVLIEGNTMEELRIKLHTLIDNGCDAYVKG